MSNTGVSPCLARETPTGASGLLGNTADLQAFCLLRTGPYAWHQDTLQRDGALTPGCHSRTLAPATHL